MSEANHLCGVEGPLLHLAFDLTMSIASNT